MLIIKILVVLLVFSRMLAPIPFLSSTRFRPPLWYPIETLKEYDLEHKNNINLRPSYRRLAVLLGQHIFKCGSVHLIVDQVGELLYGVVPLGERLYVELLI